jgi:type I restriction enzyme S subunit
MGTLRNMGTLRFAHPTNIPIHGGMMSGRYKAYAEYKDSGVEWLGVIPTHWIVSRIKFIAPYQVGWTPPTKDDANFEGENLWANISDLRGKVIFDTAKKISDEAAKVASMDITPMGSLLYSFKLSVGAVSFAGKDMYTNEAIASFLEGATLPLSYLYYVLPKFVIENASTNIYGARILNQELISNAMMLAPTSLEAEKIANFLDHETVKIDALIDKQQQLIKLLKEKRQAVISHAVTKGLNPAAPMRESGVEWLGEVPEHWESKRLKFTCECVTEKLSMTNKTVIALENIESWTGNYVETNSEYSGEDVGFSVGDILFGKLRPYLAKVLYAEVNGVALGDLLVYRPKSQVLGKYCFFQMISEGFISTVDSSTYGSKMPRASADFINDMPVLIPPLDEQKEILLFVQDNLAMFQSVIAKAESAIKLMKERRTALISAAVTGKIDVRNWQAPASFHNHQEAAA